MELIQKATGLTRQRLQTISDRLEADETPESIVQDYHSGWQINCDRFASNPANRSACAKSSSRWGRPLPVSSFIHCFRKSDQ